MSTCPSTQENLKGVTSVIIEAVFGTDNTHYEGGDVHGNIYDSNSDEGNIYEDGDKIEVFTSAANASDLDLRDDKNSNGGGESSDDDDENTTNQSNNDEE